MSLIRQFNKSGSSFTLKVSKGRNGDYSTKYVKKSPAKQSSRSPSLSHREQRLLKRKSLEPATTDDGESSDSSSGGGTEDENSVIEQGMKDGQGGPAGDAEAQAKAWAENSSRVLSLISSRTSQLSQLSQSQSQSHSQSSQMVFPEPSVAFS